MGPRRRLQFLFGAVTVVLAVVAVLTARGPVQRPTRDTAGATRDTGAPHPRLVLVLSIDQLTSGNLMRYAPLFTGGLRRLLDDGALFTQALYRHAATETAPGHALILSGRRPRETGIVANDWYDRESRQMVNAVDDASQRSLGGPGRAASPARFVGTALGDVLRGTDRRSRVVGVSAKDRSAILLAGPGADAAYWFEAAAGGFVTSSYYMQKAPAWLDAWNAEHLADTYAGMPWTRLRESPAWYEKHAGPDAAEGEADGKDTTFPHQLPPLAQKDAFYNALVRTPVGDELTLSAALAAMKAHGLGTDESTDLLAAGFSSTDFVGHAFGGDSQEMLDQLLRLDVVLGRLFAETDARVGQGRTLVVLTADHGALPIVEQLRHRQPGARRVSPAAIRDAVARALARKYPGATGLVTSLTPGVYLDTDAIGRWGLQRAEVERTVTDALLSTGLVAEVYTKDELATDGPPRDAFVSLYRSSYFASRSPDLAVRLKPYVYVSAAVWGTGHGTAYEYDRHVPIVFMGPGIVHGRYGAPSGPEDVAPTLAWLLGVPLAPAPDARILVEVAPSRTPPIP